MKRYVSSSGSGCAVLVPALLISLLAAAAPSQAAVISGTAEVESYGDEGFEGYWRYCIDVTWDTGEIGDHAMSFVNFLISLGDCPCACSPGIVRFAYPAGTGTGEDGCELSLYGLYDCKDDPHFPDLGPSVKFEYIDDGCEPGPTGSARVCFYSTFGPGEYGYHYDVLGLKAATTTARGDLLGLLPVCICGNPVENSTWGSVKALYR